MRKTLILAASAALVFLAAGCNKEQTSTSSLPSFQKEIALRAMGGGITRSAVSGTEFPQGYDMLVSAYRNLGDYPGEDSAQDYFEGIRFGYDAVSGSWKSEQGAKYYPLDGTLDFLAIAGAGINDAATGVVPSVVWGESSNVAKKAVVTVPANNAKFDDILYGSSNGQGISASGSPLVFNHAMTSVVFIAKCNVAYNAGTNSGITIDGITIDGAKYSGTLTVSNPAAGGGSGDLSAAWSSLGDSQEHVAARVWAAANTGISTSESALSGLNLTTTAATLASKPFGEGYVILPPQAAVPFTVTYTIHNGFASDGTTPLNKQVQYQYTPSGNWDMAKKNVYNIDFNLTEILINPSIVDWDEVEAEDVPVPDPAIIAANGHAFVDLGLRRDGKKILFATMNIGAESPEDIGDYFAWGETSKRYISISEETVVDNKIRRSIIGGSFEISNCPYHTGSDRNTGWSKYIATGFESYSISGVADNLLTLESSDDVASVMWGGNWRMPDEEELEFLFEGDWDYEEDYLISYGNGDGAYLLLPRQGFCREGIVYIGEEDNGKNASYWSRSKGNGTEPSHAMGLWFQEDELHPYIYREARDFGCPIRPVLEVPDPDYDEPIAG